MLGLPRIRAQPWCVCVCVCVFVVVVVVFCIDSSVVQGNKLGVWIFVLVVVIVNIKPLLLFVGCLTTQQHASVSQGRICSDKFTCCHTEIEVADQTFYLTQSQYTDTGPTSPSTEPIVPGATGVPILKSLVWLDPEKISAQAGFEPGILRSLGGRLNH